METAYDILMFWVMRMLLMGYFKTDKPPFKNVYLHGLIRDDRGQKMSKSKGNVINPLSIIEKYGADALRMALVIRSSAGLDKNVGEPEIRAMRNLTNKIWNATRFVLMSVEKETIAQKDADQIFTEQLNQISARITKQLNDYKLGLAAETAYTQFWHWFCDEQIENYKAQNLSSAALIEGLITFLKLLHPFVPYVTEGAYRQLK
jgi:valyl-tRNA synthetase